jgi:hypothetical protein
VGSATAAFAPCMAPTPPPAPRVPPSKLNAAADLKRREEELQKRLGDLDARAERLATLAVEQGRDLLAKADDHTKRLDELSSIALERARAAAAAAAAAEKDAVTFAREEAVAAEEEAVAKRREDIDREGDRLHELLKRAEADAAATAEHRRSIERRDKVGRVVHVESSS